MVRERAIQSRLQRIDGAGMPPYASCKLSLQTNRNADKWRNDRGAAAEIKARLARHGFDLLSVTAEAFVQAQRLFNMFDSLMHEAEGRRIGLLREINLRRDLGRKIQSLRIAG